MDKVYMLTVKTNGLGCRTNTDVKIYADKAAGDEAFDSKVKKTIASLSFSINGVCIDVNEPQPAGKPRYATFDDAGSRVEMVLEEKQVYS